MEVLKIATKTLQIAIQSAVDGVKAVVDSIKLTADSTKVKLDSTAIKVDTIDIKVGTLLDGRVVKSVQRGTVLGPDTTANVNITISNVDPNKCAIIVGGKNQETSTHIVPISITNSTLVLGRSTKGSAVWSALSLASWQVIEFY